MTADLQGQVALVTGSSAGIGRAAALAFARSGARVVVHGLHEERGRAVVEAIRAAGGEAVWEAADLRDPAASAELVERTVAHWGRLDILVANGAAVEVTPRPFVETTPEELDIMVRTRYLSRLYVTQAALRHMLARRSGVIAIVTTDAGRYPTPGEAIVGGIGSALIMLTKALARENARYGIRVNAVAAALTRDTPAYQRVMAGDFSQRLFRKAEERTPLGIAEPDDVAAALLYLVSPAARRVTGQVISVNGGLSFGGW
ncbi:MAG: SDR family oxidoreductase [Clostridia bacterium]|nr:SDR family oxidoreductase [Clostridia bacterium]